MLCLRYVAVENQFGQSENGVHRSADFMTHIGKKATLRLIRTICFLSCLTLLTQCLLPLQHPSHLLSD